MNRDLRFEAFLNLSDQPVYGTTITPADFEWFDEHDRFGWILRGKQLDGIDVDFIMWVKRGTDLETSTTMFCSTRDVSDSSGNLQPLPDPFRSTIGECGAVQDWFDAICMVDAENEANKRSARLWGGAEFSDVMTRVEHGITLYDSHEVAVSSFETIGELQSWVDRALSTTSARARAYVLRDFEYVPGEMLDGMLLQAMVDDEIVGYAPVIVATNQSSSDWLIPADGQAVPHPHIALRMSGAVRMGLNAGFIQSWSSVKEQARLIDDAEAKPDIDGWALLHIIGTNAALPLAWGSSNLLIETDNDGAHVAFSLHASTNRERHHRNRARFNQRWGRWLDDDVVLTEQELRDGIATAEASLRAVLAGEDR